MFSFFLVPFLRLLAVHRNRLMLCSFRTILRAESTSRGDFISCYLPTTATKYSPYSTTLNAAQLLSIFPFPFSNSSSPSSSSLLLFAVCLPSSVPFTCQRRRTPSQSASETSRILFPIFSCSSAHQLQFKLCIDQT